VASILLLQTEDYENPISSVRRKHGSKGLCFSKSFIEIYLSNLYHNNEFQEGLPMPDLDRITQSPDMMGGRPCIRGMRVTVGMIVGQIGAGVGIDELLADYPYLEREDIMQALRYAAWRSDEREVLLASA